MIAILDPNTDTDWKSWVFRTFFDTKLHLIAIYFKKVHTEYNSTRTSMKGMLILFLKIN